MIKYLYIVLPIKFKVSTGTPAGTGLTLYSEGLTLGEEDYKNTEFEISWAEKGQAPSYLSHPQSLVNCVCWRKQPFY